MTRSVLVVEDDAVLRRVLARALADRGFSVDECGDGETAAGVMARGVHDVVLLDLGLPLRSGLELLRGRVAATRRPAVVVLSGSTESTATIEAMKLGAYDFLLKPPDLDEVLDTVVRAAAGGSDGGGSLGPPPGDDEHGILVGSTPAMREVFKAIGRVAATRVAVLVTGESGTGKELVARAIHEASADPSAPFVAVNCAALSPDLLESELFGHARGAFTGAVADRVGRFEAAAGGTVLLDEIGELELNLQAKLLRVLEQRRFERVGTTETRALHARVIAATNRDLHVATSEGRFREDLYHRLAVIQIDLPPLRERRADIPLLVERLRDRVAAELGTPVDVTREAFVVLTEEPWPGNVRQLYNVLRRSAILGQGLVDADALARGAAASSAEPAASEGGAGLRTLDDVERDHIEATLRRFGWHKRRSSEALGISRVTLDRKIQRYGLERDADDSA